MIKPDYQKIEEISIEEWNNIFNNGFMNIQPLIFGYKLQIQNGEILYKHKKVNLVNRLLNKHVDKLYVESQKIKEFTKNCFIITVDDEVFVDDIESSYNDVSLIKLGYIPIRSRMLKMNVLETYDEVKSYLYKSVGISDDSKDTIFGFKIFDKHKDSVIYIRIKEKEKENFVVDDSYKFYYNYITNFIAQEFEKYPLKYHNAIYQADERVIWLAIRLSLKISMLELTFKDKHLKPIVKPFENNINYDKLPEIIKEDLSSIFMIILSILHNKTIKSGFLKPDLEEIHKNIQNFINESYCEHMYFVDNYNIQEKFK